METDPKLSPCHCGKLPLFVEKTCEVTCPCGWRAPSREAWEEVFGFCNWRDASSQYKARFISPHRAHYAEMFPLRCPDCGKKVRVV